MADQQQRTPDSPDSGRPANPPPATDGSTWIGLSSVGFEFVLAVLLPGGLGYWLDSKFGTTPWLMLVGGLFGCVTGFYVLLKAIRGPRR